MENKVFELIEKLYVEMKEGFKSVDNRFEKLDTEVNEIKRELSSVNKTVIKIEQDHGAKLDVLFDGQKQHTEQLDRIEKEVAKHEEVIIRRVK
jgi:hypothetical protein